MESNVKNKKQQAMPKSEAESFGIKRNPAIRAPRIYLSEEEIIRIMRKEAAIKKKIGNLIDSMLCDDSQISEMDNTKNKTEAVSYTHLDVYKRQTLHRICTRGHRPQTHPYRIHLRERERGKD